MTSPDVETPERPSPAADPVAPDRPEAARGNAGRCCILMNAGAGHQGGQVELTAAVERFAAEHADHIELRHIGEDDDPVSAAEAALAEGFGTLVAAGGDGTIGAVASVLHGQQARLGILPLGTFNYFARGLGIPLEIEPALDLLLHGEARDLAVSEVNGKLFLNNASLGVYPAILKQREQVYKRWGRSRLMAYWSVLLTLVGYHRARTLQVTIDGVERRRRSPLIFIARSTYQLEQFGLEGGEVIENGRFAVFLAPDVGRWGLLRFAVLLLGRSMKRNHDFELLEGCEIDISSGGRMLVARDGEKEKMRPPIRFRLRPEPLRVIAPEAGETAATGARPGAAAAAE